MTGLVVLAIDLLGETTLSDSFREFSRTPGGFVVTTSGCAYLLAHLYGVIPADRDPMVMAFARVPKRKRMVVISV